MPRAIGGSDEFPDGVSAAVVLGLLVQLKSKVPNWGFPAPYPTDFIRRTFRDDGGKFTAENSNEISLYFLKTGLSASNVRGGRLVRRDKTRQLKPGCPVCHNLYYANCAVGIETLRDAFEVMKNSTMML